MQGVADLVHDVYHAVGHGLNAAAPVYPVVDQNGQLHYPGPDRGDAQGQAAAGGRQQARPGQAAAGGRQQAQPGQAAGNYPPRPALRGPLIVVPERQERRAAEGQQRTQMPKPVKVSVQENLHGLCRVLGSQEPLSWSLADQYHRMGDGVFNLEDVNPEHSYLRVDRADLPTLEELRAVLAATHGGLDDLDALALELAPRLQFSDWALNDPEISRLSGPQLDLFFKQVFGKTLGECQDQAKERAVQKNPDISFASLRNLVTRSFMTGHAGMLASLYTRSLVVPTRVISRSVFNVLGMILTQVEDVDLEVPLTRHSTCEEAWTFVMEHSLCEHVVRD